MFYNIAESKFDIRGPHYLAVTTNSGDPVDQRVYINVRTVDMLQNPDGSTLYMLTFKDDKRKLFTLHKSETIDIEYAES